MTVNFPNNPVDGELFPITPSPGTRQYRWNNNLGAWQTVDTGGSLNFVEKTGNNNSAVIPTGVTSQRDSSPLRGYFRYNSESEKFEGFDGTNWYSLPYLIDTDLIFNISTANELLDILTFVSQSVVGLNRQILINCAPGIYEFTEPVVLKGANFSSVSLRGAPLNGNFPKGLSNSGSGGIQSGDGLAFFLNPVEFQIDSVYSTNRIFLESRIPTIFRAINNTGLFQLIQTSFGEISNIFFQGGEILNSNLKDAIFARSIGGLSLIGSSFVELLQNCAFMGFSNGIGVTDNSSISNANNIICTSNAEGVDCSRNSTLGNFGLNVSCNMNYVNGLTCFISSSAQIFAVENISLVVDFSANGGSGILIDGNSSFEVFQNVIFPNNFLRAGFNAGSGIFSTSGSVISIIYGVDISNNAGNGITALDSSSFVISTSGYNTRNISFNSASGLVCATAESFLSFLSIFNNGLSGIITRERGYTLYENSVSYVNNGESNGIKSERASIISINPPIVANQIVDSSSQII